MGTNYTATDIASGVAQQSTINAEWDAIQAALERVLNVYGDSTNGTNAMQVDFDMNSQDILNGGVANFTDIVVAGTSLAAQVAAAAASAAAAATSETNAAASEVAAAASAGSASTSATNAAASETAAATSETNAAASETAAATSETNAAASASAASTSASNAATSETNAAASAAAAATSETNAATSETNAGTSETNAAASASAAATSETNAATSAAEAAASAASIDLHKPEINNQTGTTYTLALTDEGDYIRMSNADQQVVTIPPNSSVAFAVGDKIEIYRAGDGFTTVEAGSGVTLNSERFSINKDNSATLIKLGTDEWDIVGQCSYLFTDGSVEYVGNEFSVVSQETVPNGMAFSADGTKMYVVGHTSDTVYQYTLTTAWDLSTASYAAKSVSVAAQASHPSGIEFSPDGTKMYVAQRGTAYPSLTDVVYQYTLSTAWDVSTATYATKSVDISSEVDSVGDIGFSSDGTKLYATDFGTDAVYQYTLSTAWDVSTATYASKLFTFQLGVSNVNGMAFNSDGTKLYAACSTSQSITEYTLSTAWDVSTATYEGRRIDTSLGAFLPAALRFSADGASMFMLDGTRDAVVQYKVAV